MPRNIRNGSESIAKGVGKFLKEKRARGRSELEVRIGELERAPAAERAIAERRLEFALEKRAGQLDDDFALHAKLAATGEQDIEKAALSILKRLAREEQRRNPALSAEQAFTSAAGTREGRAAWDAMRRFKGRSLTDFAEENRRAGESIKRAMDALANG